MDEIKDTYNVYIHYDDDRLHEHNNVKKFNWLNNIIFYLIDKNDDLYYYNCKKILYIHIERIK